LIFTIGRRATLAARISLFATDLAGRAAAGQATDALSIGAAIVARAEQSIVAEIRVVGALALPGGVAGVVGARIIVIAIRYGQARHATIECFVA